MGKYLSYFNLKRRLLSLSYLKLRILVYPFKALKQVYVFCFLFLFLSLWGCIYSYTQFKRETLNLYKAEVESTFLTLTNAMKSYDRYLDLIAYRIAKNGKNDSQIVKILNMDFEKFLNGPFPSVLDLVFYPSLNNQIAFSRLGPIELSSSFKNKAVIDPSNDNNFILDKEVYNLNGNKIGLLKSNISLARFIPLSFKRSSKGDLNSLCFSLKIGGEEVTYVLNKPFPTVIEFFKKDYSYMLIFAFATFILLISIFISYFTFKRILTLRRKNKNLVKLEALLQENILHLEESLSKAETKQSNSIVTSQKREELLLDTIEIFQKMAMEGHALNKVVFEILSSEWEHKKSQTEIIKIADRANQTFEKLALGIFVDSEPPSIFSLNEQLEEILGAFNGQISSQNTEVKVENTLDDYVQINPKLLKIVLYNVIGAALERYHPNKKLHIRTKYENTICLSVSDNYLLEKAGPKRFSKPNILSLNCKKLTELVHSIGWRIQFSQAAGENTTTIWFDDNLNEEKGNVISLFERKFDHA